MAITNVNFEVDIHGLFIQDGKTIELLEDSIENAIREVLLGDDSSKYNFSNGSDDYIKVCMNTMNGKITNDDISIEHRVKNLVCFVLHVKHTIYNASTWFKNYGADEIDCINLQTEFDELIKHEISAADWNKIHSGNDMIKYIKDHNNV